MLVGRGDFDRIFLEDVPLLDVRAGVEFARGAFPSAVNFPILSDAERHEVGLRYSREGPDRARELGHQLVSGAVKARRVAEWIEFIRRHPHALLYCFRGGERSRIAADWLAQAGYPVPRVEGGYRALRRHLIEYLERAPGELDLLIVGGKTGTGKSELLQAFGHSIDLESLARHRGSAFGRLRQGQPTQIDFENALAVALMKRRGRILLEDESLLIGRRSIPAELHAAMGRAPLLVLEEPLAVRVERVFREYIVDQAAEYERAAVTPGDGFAEFARYLEDSLAGIERRLGGVRYRALAQLLAEAIDRQRAGDPGAHRAWIEILLRDYYDPGYEYQLARRAHSVVFRGTREEAVEWLARSFTAD